MRLIRSEPLQSSGVIDAILKIINLLNANVTQLIASIQQPPELKRGPPSTTTPPEQDASSKDVLAQLPARTFLWHTCPVFI